ncbi:ATP-dependent DNA helicase Q1 isoform X1 [Nerophis lumbriciformis]|uniref:ATP-dependent DNA helicase Q1 isoform X1 n=2 Tax=Nerophis lumbriciformis TaxID=546530 RepID=UPI002AE04339|nr:ATP-dependent DNA helicase Q1-like isoform X1 [Nerophis lumbriciformis]
MLFRTNGQTIETERIKCIDLTIVVIIMDDRGQPNDIQEELDSVEAELELVELQIAELHEKKTELTSRKNALLSKLEDACESASASSSSSKSSKAMSNEEMQQYECTDFAWSRDLTQQLTESFHLSNFRPVQLKAINLTMAGKDLFIVMPTGRGKSLCYQLPAICSDGFTLVVTPLVSLMEDQTMYLKSIGLSAVMLNASSTKEHSKAVMAGMIDKKARFKMIYVTPEKIAKSKMFMSRLEKANNAGLLSRIAVDEVHCCSQWGHDFRPDYKRLGILKRQFPKVPLIGLTATATSSILKDCGEILCVQNPVTLKVSFHRSNLYYEVRVKISDSAMMNDITSLIKNRYKDQSGIIYVLSQKDADSVSAELQQRDIIAYPYHANMNPDDKSRIHRKWTSGKIQVVVATVAFGMGIDKADVRFVIHHTISKSIENYYQESGRAGRDDLPADCIAYFGFADIFRISTMVVMENVGHKKLMEMVSYCQSVDRCRSSVMAVHFDEVWDDIGCNSMCDVCRNAEDFLTLDITKHAKQLVQILELAASMDEKLTPLKLVEAWMGKGPTKHRKLMETSTLSRLQAEDVIIQLLLQEYFREEFSFTPYTTHSYLKLGRKAPLLKSPTHTLSMKMRATHDGHSLDVSPSNKEDIDVVTNSIAASRQKQKAHKDLSRPAEQDKCTHMYAAGDGTNIMAQHIVEVEVEINVPKQKSSSPQRERKKAHAYRTTVPTVSSSPSRTSVISETAAEELCDLRKYYSKQLRRINYISHEYLGQPAESDALACIREPFRSLRLPRRTTITQTARSLWTRVSSRRTLVHR